MSDKLTWWQVSATGFGRRAADILIEDVQSENEPTLDGAAKILLLKAQAAGFMVPNTPRGAPSVERLRLWGFDKPIIERLGDD